MVAAKLLEDIPGSEVALRTFLLPGNELSPFKALLPILLLASSYLDPVLLH